MTIVLLRGYVLSLVTAAAVANFLDVSRNFTDPENGEYVMASPLGGPLPIHLLDLSKGENKGYVTWDLCNTGVHSNLGGLGPDKAWPVKEHRFSYAGKYHGEDIDLVFVNKTEYRAAEVRRNTARGCFGVIHVAHDTKVDLEFAFVLSGTNKVIDLKDDLYISFFDFDCSKSGCESIEISEDVEYFVDDESELVAGSGKPGNITFHGSTFGIGADNPPPLEALQLARALTFKLKHGMGKITLGVENSKIGRNFLIAGKTYIPDKGTTTTTTILATGKSCSNCIIWGDPHVITFDAQQKRRQQHPMREAFFRTRGWKSDQVSIYAAGTFWLVKSKRVRIQARYWHNKTHPDWTNLGSLALSGPFLNDNTLVIRPLSSATTWNQKEILATLPSTFQNELVDARFHHHSEIVKDGKPGIGIDIALPEGVRLTVNRWKQNLAVKIGMCPQAGGQEGQCGNYNGISTDDIGIIMNSPSAQRVPENEFLFQKPHATLSWPMI